MAGGLASLGFFLWVAQGCRFPRLAGLTPASVVTGPAMLTLFFAAHSLLGGRPPWVYLPVNAVLLWAAMLTWRPTGITVWAFGPAWLNYLELAAYVLTVLALLPAQALSMTGIRNPPAGLIQTGVYAVIRHPMHVLLIAFLTLAPTMSLDRLLVLMLTLFYLLVAIPLEEYRMAKKFGSEYGRYVRRVHF